MTIISDFDSRDPEGVENLTLGDCNGRKIPTQRRDYICRQPEVVNSIVAEVIGRWCVGVAQIAISLGK